MGLVVVEKLEQASSLDPVGDRLQGFVRSVLRSQWLRDALHGVWLGHPLHPVLVQVPIAGWLATALMDALPGQERGATVLLAAGNVAAIPTAVAGANDWSTLSRDQRRVGLIHAASNGVSVGLAWWSLVARLRGKHGLGRRLSLVALGVAAGSAYLGGHLSYQQAGGVNHAAPWLRFLPSGWHDLGEVSEFVEGKPAVRQVGGVPLLVFRQGERFTVLVERCAHQGGPLGEGDVVEAEGDQCVVCPWHGSTFRLADGSVIHGPAATNQPALESRVRGGRVEARR
jgi:nitrite reductase/ring-hydroxylating ferredoxin subunit